MKLTARRAATIIGLGVIGVALCAGLGYEVWCFGNPPVCRSEADLFYAEPEIVAEIQPHVADWLSRPEAETAVERDAIGRKLGVGINISHIDDTRGRSFPVVRVAVESYYEWTRGMLFFQEPDIDLHQDSMFQTRKTADGVYVFNSNY